MTEINREKTRCGWARNDLSIAYHDAEWGAPQRDDRKLFEFLILEAAQAGLSWDTILRKRENYRRAFDDFDWKKIARYDERKAEELLRDEGIVRHRLKIASAIHNARLFEEVRGEFGSFDAYVWRFVGGAPVVNRWKNLAEVPAASAASAALGKDLKKRGFNFVGATVMYAFMQACGLVNDHLVSCFRHGEV